MKHPIKRPPIHPGRILKTEIEEAGLTANALALALRVPANRLTEILNGRRAVTADTAMRLGRFFDTSAQMWMNLQTRYELQVVEDSSAERILADVQPLRRAG
jgi:addiction module HigA family antidote